MSNDRKKEGELLREKLMYKPKNGYVRLNGEDKLRIHEYCEGYKDFVNTGKTERACVKLAVDAARKRGFVEFKRGMKLKAGDRIYQVNRGKSAVFAVIGSARLDDGINIAAAHIDAPHIDIKQNPMYEENGQCLLKTHYYGGIKKYQWPAIPLALHGVVATKNGKTIELSIGEGPNDPVFTITDLLPHLGKEQMAKSLADSFPGESLNVLVGSEPYIEEKLGKDNVKLNILKLLNDRYGMTEEDFLSAELSIVPTFPARDVGLDKSLIGAFGHDDRVCAYPALTALFDCVNPEVTAVCALADKEEIGSEGVSGMKSKYFDTFVEDMCESLGTTLRECYEKSCCLSADVLAGMDPNFPDVLDKRNAAYINCGMSLCKYTGARGKSGASDAAAELVARMRRIFDESGVIWQMGALGKVDQGGGGTVAMFMAQRNIDTIDAGVPVLSMHSPFEVVSKLDVYMTYKAIYAFYNEKK